jgi:hypothetical protein
MSNRKLGSIKLICPNESCLNKSVVYRKFDAMREHRCKKCDWLLASAGSVKTKREQAFNNKVKEQLKEMGNV